MDITFDRHNDFYSQLAFDEQGVLLTDFDESVEIVNTRIKEEILVYRPDIITLRSSTSSLPLELISAIYLRVVHATKKVYMDDSLVAAHG
jgi:hypothetical protein